MSPIWFQKWSPLWSQKWTPKVTLFLRWMKYLHATGWGPEEAVWVNMDETRLFENPENREGCYMRVKRKWRRFFKDPISPGARRLSHTLVAAIAMQEEWQERLPQMLIWKQMSLREYADMRHVCDQVFPRSLYYATTQNGWIDRAKMLGWLQLLRLAVKRDEEYPKIVLVMDAAPVHMTQRVIEQATEWNMRILCIPGGLTSVLQPLDLSVFKPLKATLDKICVANRCDSESGVLARATWANCVASAVDMVLLQRSWRRSFEICGFVENSELHGHKVRKHEGIYQSSTAAPLTSEEFSFLIGKRCRLGLWKCVFPGFEI